MFVNAFFFLIKLLVLNAVLHVRDRILLNNFAYKNFNKNVCAKKPKAIKHSMPYCIQLKDISRQKAQQFSMVSHALCSPLVILKRKNNKYSKYILRNVSLL